MKIVAVLVVCMECGSRTSSTAEYEGMFTALLDRQDVHSNYWQSMR